VENKRVDELMHVSDKDLMKRYLYFKYQRDQGNNKEGKKPKNDSIATFYNISNKGRRKFDPYRNRRYRSSLS
jgi:hypothetical protein